MNDVRGRAILALLLLVAVVAAVAGVVLSTGDDADAPEASRTAETGSPSAQTAATTPPAQTPGSQATSRDPASAATEEAFTSAFGHLGRAVLRVNDLPPGYTARSNAPITKQDAVASNVLSIRRLAEYLESSDLRALWGSLFRSPSGDNAISSIIYEFETPEDAAGLIDTFSSLTKDDYPVAKSVERVQADDIEDGAQMMLYVLEGTGTIEYTWAQGKYAGQVLVRFAGETPGPNAAATLVALARVQAEKMRELP